MDFTLRTYRRLLVVLQAQGYSFQTFETFIPNPLDKAVILRHDVDRLPANALKMAELERALGIAASYYFRSIPASYNQQIINRIGEWGHEIGYHYEDLSLFKGDAEKAIHHFGEQLGRFRQLYPVKTICMHGSPLSRYDNRDLWKHYDYRDFGIIAEPYFDVNFNDVFYLTDTGRQWNNAGVSVRDRVTCGFDLCVKSTLHLIALGEAGDLPNRMMMTVHPQRWFDFGVKWCGELVNQNVKNVVKNVLIRLRNEK